MRLPVTCVLVLGLVSVVACGSFEKPASDDGGVSPARPDTAAGTGGAGSGGSGVPASGGAGGMAGAGGATGMVGTGGVASVDAVTEDLSGAGDASAQGGASSTGTGGAMPLPGVDSAVDSAADSPTMTPPDPCAGIVCMNGGSCSQGKCVNCNPGFFGDRCERRDPCHEIMCMNGGTCSAGKCINCNPGYSGDRCERRDPCHEVTCMNGGRCSGGKCTNCNPGYSGDRCEVRDPCHQVSCMNGGRCANGNCVDCNNGYTGDRCQTCEVRDVYCAALAVDRGAVTSAMNCTRVTNSYARVERMSPGSTHNDCISLCTSKLAPLAVGAAQCSGEQKVRCATLAWDRTRWQALGQFEELCEAYIP